MHTSHRPLLLLALCACAPSDGSGSYPFSTWDTSPSAPQPGYTDTDDVDTDIPPADTDVADTDVADTDVPAADTDTDRPPPVYGACPTQALPDLLAAALAAQVATNGHAAYALCADVPLEGADCAALAKTATSGSYSTDLAAVLEAAMAAKQCNPWDTFQRGSPCPSYGYRVIVGCGPDPGVKDRCCFKVSSDGGW